MPTASGEHLDQLMNQAGHSHLSGPHPVCLHCQLQCTRCFLIPGLVFSKSFS